MSLHPEYEALLGQMNEAEGPALTEMSPSEGREMYRAMQPEAPDLEVGKVEDLRIPGPGGDIPIRIYSPQGVGPFPITLMFHGGGWVIGDLTTADLQSREVCKRVETIVVSVDYRLSPEHKFPAASDDCYAATQWASQNAETLKGDKNRIAVAGDSAGGHLAAVVAQMARDKSGPSIVFQLLVYPVTDGSTFETASYHENAEGYMLTTESMRWFWNHYADAPDRLNPYASPLLAENLSQLPPCLIMTAEFDPLRDEGEKYGKLLQDAGVPTDIKRYDGFIHGFFAHTRLIPATNRAMEDACSALQKAFY